MALASTVVIGPLLEEIVLIVVFARLCDTDGRNLLDFQHVERLALRAYIAAPRIPPDELITLIPSTLEVCH